MAVSAKARVVQLTVFSSITAAAEGPVTFGCCFYRWKARLLSGWGSSLAQGTGGRVRAPAPTAYPKVRLIFCRARCPHRAVPGRPRCAAPTSGRNPLGRAGEGSRSCEMGESSGFAAGADDLGGPLRGLCDSRAHPHPPRMRSAPSPWKGEGLWAAQCAVPTVGNGPGALVRKPRRRSGIAPAPIFPKPRPPVGPDGTARKHS